MNRRWTAAALVLLLPLALFPTLWRPAEPKEKDLFEFKRFYVDIYDPIFRHDLQQDGSTLYRQKRNLGSESDSFLMPKPKDTFRIFVVGGSVAQFFKIWPNGGSWQEHLAALSPGKTFEFVNCGYSAYDSYRESLIVDEIAAYSPDLLVLFSGNNEFYRPTFVRWPRLAYLAFRLRRAGWLPSPKERLEPSLVPRSERDAEFEGHLRGMVRTGRAGGARVVLCTLANNLADYAPSGVPPSDAFTRYFKGRELERAGKLAEAMGEYEAAADKDIDPMRCPPARNAIIRRVAKEEGAGVADLDRAFRRVDPRLGLSLFYDGVHWLREYNPFVAAEITRALAAQPGAPPFDAAALDRWQAQEARPAFTPEARRGYLFRVLVHAGQNTSSDGYVDTRAREFLANLDRMEPGSARRLPTLHDAFITWGKDNSQRMEQQEEWWPRLMKARE